MIGGRIGRTLAALALAYAARAAHADDCRVPLDREYTLRVPVPHLVEAEHARMAAGEARLAFTLPRPNGAACGDSAPAPLIAYRNDSAGELFAAGLMAGEEYRNDGDGTWATEAGGIFHAAKGPVTAHLDARVFSELGGDRARASYDGESIDNQDKAVTGTVDYRSYSRFRGDVNLETAFGRLTVARDAAHWGPGLYANGVLSQEAHPFYQYSYAIRIGPLSVTSLYGDLQIDPDQNSAANAGPGRSLYAHRYELALGSNVLLGVSEEIILYDLSKPYLFAPVFPLFIAKTTLSEESNNGLLACDATWRTPWKGLVYGEFLLDDLESPSSLFTKDYVQNKWGVLAGTHFVRDIGAARAGLVLEFSHMEPWVYTHFQPNTAQAANLGMPIGNPYGPDSRTVIAKAYARLPRGGYAGLTGGLFWKGTGPGSGIDQPTPKDAHEMKVRLQGEDGPDIALEPELEWPWKRISFEINGRIGHGSRMRAGLRFFL